MDIFLPMKLSRLGLDQYLDVKLFELYRHREEEGPRQKPPWCEGKYVINL